MVLGWLLFCGCVGYDETTLAIGLGFTCHLVAMISNYLDIPLRYPMMHRGSRSLIYDHIMDKLSDSERELVLSLVSVSIATQSRDLCTALLRFTVDGTFIALIITWIPQWQPHRHSGLATLPSVGAVP